MKKKIIAVSTYNKSNSKSCKQIASLTDILLAHYAIFPPQRDEERLHDKPKEKTVRKAGKQNFLALRTVPTKTKVFLHGLLLCGKSRS